MESRREFLKNFPKRSLVLFLLNLLLKQILGSPSDKEAITTSPEKFTEPKWRENTPYVLGHFYDSETSKVLYLFRFTDDGPLLVRDTFLPDFNKTYPEATAEQIQMFETQFGNSQLLETYDETLYPVFVHSGLRPEINLTALESLLPSLLEDDNTLVNTFSKSEIEETDLINYRHWVSVLLAESLIESLNITNLTDEQKAEMVKSVAIIIRENIINFYFHYQKVVSLELSAKVLRSVFLDTTSEEKETTEDEIYDFIDSLTAQDLTLQQDLEKFIYEMISANIINPETMMREVKNEFNTRLDFTKTTEDNLLAHFVTASLQFNNFLRYQVHTSIINPTSGDIAIAIKANLVQNSGIPIDKVDIKEYLLDKVNTAFISNLEPKAIDKYRETISPETRADTYRHLLIYVQMAKEAKEQVLWLLTKKDSVIRAHKEAINARNASSPIFTETLNLSQTSLGTYLDWIQARLNSVRVFSGVELIPEVMGRYRPKMNKIKVKPFSNLMVFYNTLLHELAHAVALGGNINFEFAQRTKELTAPSLPDTGGSESEETEDRWTGSDDYHKRPDERLAEIIMFYLSGISVGYFTDENNITAKQIQNLIGLLNDEFGSETIITNMLEINELCVLLNKLHMPN